MNQMKGMMMNMIVNYNNDNNQISAVRNDSFLSVRNTYNELQMSQDKISITLIAKSCRITYRKLIVNNIRKGVY